MSLCHGCGGVVGRDCFNPQECEWITRDMAQRLADGRAEQEWESRMYLAERERAYYTGQEQEFEAERFEATTAGVA